MGWVKDTFFGGAEKEASKQQIAAGDRAMATQKEYYEQARNDIMKLFPQAYQGIQSSFQQGIDQISAGKASANDILRQAFNQSNQIQQSGSNAAISALLGRPQQMQLPQAMPMQQVGQTEQSKLMSNYAQPAGLRGNQFAGIGQQSLVGGAPMDRPLATMGQPPVSVNQPQVIGGIAQQITDPNAPTMSQYNAPSAQPQSLGATPQVQNNVDMSGIGLSGAESALQSGLNAQTGALQGGSQQAQNTLQQTLGGQLGALRGGVGGAENALNQYGYQALGAANQGFNQARNDIANSTGVGRNDIAQGLAGAMSSIGSGAGALAAAQTQGLNRIDQSTGQAIGYLDPYASTGAEAQQREAALSGALGNAAQQQAISGFMESPGQKFLRERQEQALLRNASATGGLRGGSTLSALQEQASGIAAQQQQQQLENMRNIAQRGQQAAGQQGQFAQTGGTTGANLIGQIAGQQAQLMGQAAGMQANAGQNLAQLSANAGSQMGGYAAQGGQFAGNTLNQLGNQIGGLRAGLGQMEAGAIGDVGGNVAGLQNQLGGNLANAYGGTSNNLAGLRSQAGQQVAGQLNNQTNQLSNNQLNLGQLLAGLDTNTASQLAQLMTQGGTAGANSQMNLATLLANLASGQGSNLSNIQIGQGNAQAGGTIGSAGGAREGVGTAIGGLLTGGLFSDERLKDNITKIAEGPVDLFVWTWKHIKEIPESLRGVASVGTIAQQVKERFPNCVVERDGYYAVNLAQLSQEIANV